MEYTEKLRDCFDEMVVYKDLKKTNFSYRKQRKQSQNCFKALFRMQELQKAYKRQGEKFSLPPFLCYSVFCLYSI